jgi:hypothetical protein
MRPFAPGGWSQGVAGTIWLSPGARRAGNLSGELVELVAAGIEVSGVRHVHWVRANLE